MYNNENLDINNIMKIVMKIKLFNNPRLTLIASLFMYISTSYILARFYLYILREFKKLVMVSKNVNNTHNLIR